MESEFDRALFRATSPSPAVLDLPSDAEAQQNEIIDEEERSTDALELERYRAASPGLEAGLPNGHLELAAWGRALAAASVELRAAAVQIQTAAKFARHVATKARGQSIAIRRICEGEPCSGAKHDGARDGRS